MYPRLLFSNTQCCILGIMKAINHVLIRNNCTCNSNNIETVLGHVMRLLKQKHTLMLRITIMV